MREHSLTAGPTHSVWDRSLAPRVHIDSGDEVHFECVDSSGAQVRPSMSITEYLAIEQNADSCTDRSRLREWC